MGKQNTIEQNVGCPMGDQECRVSEKLDAMAEEIQSLKAQVSTDPLTSLYNTRHLRQVLEQEMERTRRSHFPTTFIIIDVDHFKHVNDHYGHVVGDRALIHLASLIKTTVRKIDIACRYGGEEFAVILPSTPLLIGTQVAERIRKRIEENPLVDGDTTLNLTVSAGVDSFTHFVRDGLEQFISRADQQLYQAKESGRNCVKHAAEKITSKAEVTQSEKDALFNQLLDNDDETK